MTQTAAIFLATALVVLATLIPTYVISKRSAVSEDDWAVADRSLPIYVVIGTQFAQCHGRRYSGRAFGKCVPEWCGNSDLWSADGFAVFLYHDSCKMDCARITLQQYLKF